MSSLPELELSQLAASSTVEGVERQEEEDDLRSSAALAAASPVPAPDTADMNAPEPKQIAGSAAGEGVERQEEEDVLPAPAAPAVPAPDTADRRAPVPQEEESEMLEAKLIIMRVENTLLTRVFIVPNPMAVRYVYGALFGLMTVVAWILRDIELSRFDQANGCDGSHDCIAANGVLRASMALAVSFLFAFELADRLKVFCCSFISKSGFLLSFSTKFLH
jgi:hypothetical protein